MPLTIKGERSRAKKEKQAQRWPQSAKNKLERVLYLNEQKAQSATTRLKRAGGLAEQLLIEAIKVADINLDSFRSGKFNTQRVERANVRKFEGAGSSFWF